MDDEYQRAEVGGFNRGLPPDGLHQCSVDRFDFIEAKKGTDAGKMLLKTELAVAVGEHRGWPVELIHALENKDRLGMLKDHLNALEVQVESLAELETALPRALDAVVIVKVWTTKKTDENGVPYRNAVVTQRLHGLSVAAPVSDVPVIDDETGIPF